MSGEACDFRWYELMTQDVAGAKTFYGAVLGWTSQDVPSPAGTYCIMSVGDHGTAGILEMPEHVLQAGGKAVWLGYIGVKDADAAAAATEDAGGKVHRAPADIPGVGRFAVLSDPQGAIFQVMQPFPTEVPPPLPAQTPGTAGWHELYSSDWRAALDFYGKQFGWTAADAHDMGSMGIYQLFTAGAEPIGGMMNMPQQIPKPMWVFYFWVEDIHAAAERVGASGGRISMGPAQVPGGNWVLQASDPQGALFALVAPAR